MASSGGEQGAGSDPILDPISRLSEIMFGLLMTLTFTGTMSVVIGDGGNVRSVLLAALGCNLAWGIVDGTMYVLTSVTERGRDLARRRKILASGPEDARQLMRAALPNGAGKIMNDAEADRLVAWMKNVPDDGKAVTIDAMDVRAAGLVFLLVVGATLPPSVPFLLLDNVHAAMRFSNLIAIIMLFLIGWKFDQEMNRTSIPMRFTVPVIGCLLVGTTIALGG